MQGPESQMQLNRELEFDEYNYHVLNNLIMFQFLSFPELFFELFLYMTFIYLILSKIICLNTFSDFLSFVDMSFKLSILSNSLEHLKKLASYYTLFSFIFSEILEASFTNHTIYNFILHTCWSFCLRKNAIVIMQAYDQLRDIVYSLYLSYFNIISVIQSP